MKKVKLYEEQCPKCDSGFQNPECLKTCPDCGAELEYLGEVIWPSQRPDPSMKE